VRNAPYIRELVDAAGKRGSESGGSESGGSESEGPEE
jgi:hypothetical protein